LDIESTNCPGVCFADPAKFLFDKWSDLAGQDAFAILGTPDKMGSELVGDMFDMLCFHPRQSNRCSNLVEGHIRAALSLLERERDVAALSSRGRRRHLYQVLHLARQIRHLDALRFTQRYRLLSSRHHHEWSL
jgi:hypothetical protein